MRGLTPDTVVTGMVSHAAGGRLSLNVVELDANTVPAALRRFETCVRLHVIRDVTRELK